MDGALLRKNVVFLGMWRTLHMDDGLAREIARKLRTLRGQAAMLEVRTVGVRLYTRSGDQESVIRMPNVQDIAINRYEPMSLLCVLKEGRRLAVVVCMCSNPRDSSDIVKSFRASRRNERIVEQETETRRNWSPQQRQQERSITHTEKRHRHKEPSTAPRVQVCDVGIQTGPTDSDNISLSLPSLTSNDLRDELAHLSEEVKAIKILIEKSTGVPNYGLTKLSARQKSSTDANKTSGSDPDNNSNRRLDVTSDLKEDSTKEQQIDQTQTFLRGKFVSAKSPGYLSDDIGENPPSDAILSGYPSVTDAIDSGVQSFSVSPLFGEMDDTKNIDDLMNDREPDNPHQMTGFPISSLSRNAQLTTYITAPPGFPTHPVPERDRTYTSPAGRCYYRQPKAVVFSSTVPKSIENVYRSTRRHNNTNRRSRQVLTPEFFSSHDKERRQRSHSAHDSNRGQHALPAEEDMELQRSLHTLYNEI